MPKKKKALSKPFIKYHNDGTVWAKGQTIKDVPTGYWEWFRKTGTKMRSGSFENGEQTGQWTTYDKDGKVFKVTIIKLKAKFAGA
jgi:antitoxin component YwqK of YwqJK toxin-antitoxin module